jgi:tRNA1(Val) A37 N6-methylase TrmN6
LATLLKPNGQLYLLLHAVQRDEVIVLAEQTGLQGVVHALQTSPVRSAKRLLVHLWKGSNGVREGSDIAAYDPTLRVAVLERFEALDL